MDDVRDDRMEFLARVTHDLRTQVHALGGYSELLGHVTRNGPAGQLATSVHQRALALQELVDDLLDVATLGSGGLGLRPAPTDVRQLVATAVTTVTMAEKLPAVDVRIAVGDDVPDLVVLDGRRVRQALGNLLSNALRFTLDGAVDVVVTVGDGLGGDVAVRFDVNDTGPGIAPEQLGQIFRPFARGGARPVRGSEGTGLGLTIVREVVAAMGGEVGVDSELGHGASFWFTVPCLPAAGPDVVAVSTAPAAAPAPLTARVAATILVVDDSDTNLQLVDLQLRALGHAVVTAPSGRDALAVMSADVDLVLMDLNMPDLDGVETTRRLRALGWTTPIVALTAAAVSTEGATCLAVGMDDFLTKPISLHDLGAAVDRVLGRASAPHARPAPAPVSAFLPAGASPADPIGNTAVATLLRDIGPTATLALFEVFFTESAVQHRAIEAAIRDRDDDAYRRAAHTLASTSALVGGTDLAELCRDAERQGFDGTAPAAFGDRLVGLLAALNDELRGLSETIGRRAA